MDLVEAIDAWIDDRIEDLSDSKLEKVLEILDAVSASEFADLETDHVYNDDIYALVDSVGGSPAKRDSTEDVLRAAFFGTPLSADMLLDADVQPDAADEPATATLVEEDLVVISGDSALEADELASGADVNFNDDDQGEPTDTVSDEAAARLHQDFLANVTRAGADRAAAQVAMTAPTVAPVMLRAGDDLGPSFLPPVIEEPPKKKLPWKQWAFAVFMIAGLGVFGFGTYRLFGTLGQVDDSIGTATRPEAIEQPTASSIPTAEPEAQAAAEPEPVAETPTPTPVPPATPTPQPRVGIRLETGDIMLATFGEDGALPEQLLVYDASTSDDLDPADTLIWLGNKLGLISSAGNLLTIDPTDRQPEPELVYEPVNGLGAAVEFESLADEIVVRTDEGNVLLVPLQGQVNPEAIAFLWDAREEETAAVDIATAGELVPIVLDDGSTQLIDTANNNRVTELRDAPEEDQAAALTVEASGWGILVGIDDGSVARYQPGRDDPERFDSIWTPNDDDETRAIGAISAADRTAVVLANGSVMLVNERGGGPRIWDAENTETLALSVTSGPGFVAVVLDSGSVVRIPLSRDEIIAPIWDLTDDTLEPATQVAVEQLASE